MRYLKTTIWLMIFIGITIIFNISFRMISTPAGTMGEVSAVNIAASVAYILFWVLLSFISGYKKFRNVLTAAVIYSCLPFFGLLGFFLIGTRLAIIIMFVFYCGVPVQGISQALIYLLLPLFLLGYKLGTIIKKNGQSAGIPSKNS